ncbi:putative hypothetical protein [Streptomyces sp. NBRC 110611]|nr:putative hypothetical protein [Streptomyces sp. NBRC 110611]
MIRPLAVPLVGAREIATLLQDVPHHAHRVRVPRIGGLPAPTLGLGGLPALLQHRSEAEHPLGMPGLGSPPIPPLGLGALLPLLEQPPQLDHRVQIAALGSCTVLPFRLLLRLLVPVLVHPSPVHPSPVRDDAAETSLVEVVQHALLRRTMPMRPASPALTATHCSARRAPTSPDRSVRRPATAPPAAQATAMVLTTARHEYDRKRPESPPTTFGHAPAVAQMARVRAE